VIARAGTIASSLGSFIGGLARRLFGAPVAPPLKSTEVLANASTALVAPAPIASTESSGPWYPLLGSRIALGATGFEIALEQTGARGSGYILISPEGRAIAYSGHLDELKRFAELHAQWRSEFFVPPDAMAAIKMRRP
jgi:hypothetical protein